MPELEDDGSTSAGHDINRHLVAGLVQIEFYRRHVHATKFGDPSDATLTVTISPRARGQVQLHL